MRFRTGFVSNSSSSSYVLYGFDVDLENDIDKFLYIVHDIMQLISYERKNELKKEITNKSYDVEDYIEEIFYKEFCKKDNRLKYLSKNGVILFGYGFIHDSYSSYIDDPEKIEYFKYFIDCFNYQYNIQEYEKIKPKIMFGSVTDY